MKGVIYGVGVGPGDPELITVKAVRIIQSSDLIGIPAKTAESCTAYRIALQTVPEMAQKPVIAVPVPMTEDRTRLNACYEEGSRRLAEQLEQGKRIAFLNLGDPTVYGSFMEIHRRLREAGYESEIVSGVPSFCAAAAALGVPLGSGREEIHILPGLSGPEGAMEYKGSRIVMKAGRGMGELKDRLLEASGRGELTACAVTDCGMETEKRFSSPEQFPEKEGYFTTVLIRENRDGGV